MFFLALFVSQSHAQDNTYKDLYLKGDYKNALGIIITKLNEIYSTRVSDKEIPANYFPIDNDKSESDSEKKKKTLIRLFHGRKEKGFYIEDNPVLADLHLYAGLCYGKLGKKYDALNHYIQSLRFRNITSDRDDEIYYQISQIFRSMNDPLYFKGYIDALEQAYTLNNTKYEYSYELGMSLFLTPDKKRAIFHLERYLFISGKADADVYLKLANLYESIERYIECEKYYNEYLRLKPDDINIMFAAGYIAYYRTGNYTLAEFMLQGVLSKAGEREVYLRAKANEYLGDMALSSLKYDLAISYYGNSITYCIELEKQIKQKEQEKLEIENNINTLKMSILNNKNAIKFVEYESLLIDYDSMLNELGKKESELKLLYYNLKKLTPGRVHWNMAVTLEKKEDYLEAIRFYEAAVKYEYNKEKARLIIDKLRLKIKRGY